MTNEKRCVMLKPVNYRIRSEYIMPKIPSKASVILSLVLSNAFSAILLGIAVIMPMQASKSTPAGQFLKTVLYDSLGEEYIAWFLVWGYIVLGLAIACCIAVTLLLLRVQKGLVFTPKSVSYIRFVSWMCVLLAAVIFIGQFFHPAAFIVTLAMAFLGICLRVVKNVIEAATEIKNENDLTV